MMKKRIISLTLAIVIALLSIMSFSSCKKKITYENPTGISFKAALDYDYLKTLDGTPVTINGYMATNSSPIDGLYIYLMNLPYQSCPYCIPNTNELANTMTVYAPAGEKFDYTDKAIKVTGILDVSDSKDQYFTDYYGYEFNFKIVDAVYEIMDDEVSPFNEIAESGVYDELSKMYDYLHFVTHWYDYTASFESGKDYLWPGNAYELIITDGYQYNYGIKEGYFDGIRAKIRSISETEFDSIIALVDEAEALSNDAFEALKAGLDNETVYKAVYKYSEEFGDTRYQYEYITDDLQVRYNTAYENFISAFEY